MRQVIIDYVRSACDFASCGNWSAVLGQEPDCTFFYVRWQFRNLHVYVGLSLFGIRPALRNGQDF